MLNAIPGMRCVAPQAAFYVLPSVSLPPGRTDEHYVLSLLRETGILCVNGSGFGVPASGGFFRIVFLANPQELASIYTDIGPSRATTWREARRSRATSAEAKQECARIRSHTLTVS